MAKFAHASALDGVQSRRRPLGDHQTNLMLDIIRVEGASVRRCPYLRRTLIREGFAQSVATCVDEMQDNPARNRALGARFQ